MFKGLRLSFSSLNANYDRQIRFDRYTTAFSSALCLAIVIVICCFLESSPGTPAQIYLASSLPRYDFIVVAD